MLSRGFVALILAALVVTPAVSQSDTKGPPLGGASTAQVRVLGSTYQQQRMEEARPSRDFVSGFASDMTALRDGNRRVLEAVELKNTAFTLTTDYIVDVYTKGITTMIPGAETLVRFMKDELQAIGRDVLGLNVDEVLVAQRESLDRYIVNELARIIDTDPTVADAPTLEVFKNAIDGKSALPDRFARAMSAATNLPEHLSREDLPVFNTEMIKYMYSFVQEDRQKIGELQTGLSELLTTTARNERKIIENRQAIEELRQQLQHSDSREDTIRRTEAERNAAMRELTESVVAGVEERISAVESSIATFTVDIGTTSESLESFRVETTERLDSIDSRVVGNTSAIARNSESIANTNAILYSTLSPNMKRQAIRSGMYDHVLRLNILESDPSLTGPALEREIAARRQQEMGSVEREIAAMTIADTVTAIGSLHRIARNFGLIDQRTSEDLGVLLSTAQFGIALYFASSPVGWITAAAAFSDVFAGGGENATAERIKRLEDRVGELEEEVAQIKADVDRLENRLEESHRETVSELRAIQDYLRRINGAVSDVYDAVIAGYYGDYSTIKFHGDPFHRYTEALSMSRRNSEINRGSPQEPRAPTLLALTKAYEEIERRGDVEAVLKDVVSMLDYYEDDDSKNPFRAIDPDLEWTHRHIVQPSFALFKEIYTTAPARRSGRALDFTPLFLPFRTVSRENTIRLLDLGSGDTPNYEPFAGSRDVFLGADPYRVVYNHPWMAVRFVNDLLFLSPFVEVGNGRREYWSRIATEMEFRPDGTLPSEQTEVIAAGIVEHGSDWKQNVLSLYDRAEALLDLYIGREMLIAGVPLMETIYSVVGTGRHNLDGEQLGALIGLIRDNELLQTNLQAFLLSNSAAGQLVDWGSETSRLLLVNYYVLESGFWYEPAIVSLEGEEMSQAPEDGAQVIEYLNLYLSEELGLEHVTFRVTTPGYATEDGKAVVQMILELDEYLETYPELSSTELNLDGELPIGLVPSNILGKSEFVYNSFDYSKTPNYAIEGVVEAYRNPETGQEEFRSFYYLPLLHELKGEIQRRRTELLYPDAVRLAEADETTNEQYVWLMFDSQFYR